jgi:hypothetical protein
MRRYGSIEYALTCAQELREAAEKSFAEAYGDLQESDDKEFIRQSIQYMLDRSS